MNAARILAAVLFLGAQGCSGWDELMDYCERSGDCVCTDGDCCAIGGQPCTAGMACCDGYACVGGKCGWGPVPLLRFDPQAMDFGHTDRVASPPWAFSLLNVGTVPTQRLELDLAAMWNFSVESTCEGAVLQPGEACTGTVTFTPTRVDETPFVRTLSVAEVLPRLTARPVVSLTATGRAGHLLKVRKQDATVTVNGVGCSTWDWTCVFSFDVPSVASVVSTPSAGYHLEEVAGGCATSPCEVYVRDVVEVVARARPNLTVTVTTNEIGRYGGLYVSSPAVTPYTASCGSGDSRECQIPAAGTTTLTVDAYYLFGRTPEWGGACSGTTGSVCTVDVSGATAVTLHLRR